MPKTQVLLSCPTGLRQAKSRLGALGPTVLSDVLARPILRWFSFCACLQFSRRWFSLKGGVHAYARVSPFSWCVLRAWLAGICTQMVYDMSTRCMPAYPIQPILESPIVTPDISKSCPNNYIWLDVRLLGTLPTQLRPFPCLQAVSTSCAAPSPPWAV